MLLLISLNYNHHHRSHPPHRARVPLFSLLLTCQTKTLVRCLSKLIPREWLIYVDVLWLWWRRRRRQCVYSHTYLKMMTRKSFSFKWGSASEREKKFLLATAAARCMNTCQDRFGCLSWKFIESFLFIEVRRK